MGPRLIPLVAKIVSFTVTVLKHEVKGALDQLSNQSLRSLLYFLVRFGLGNGSRRNLGVPDPRRALHVHPHVRRRTTRQGLRSRPVARDPQSHPRQGCLSCEIPSVAPVDSRKAHPGQDSLPFDHQASRDPQRNRQGGGFGVFFDLVSTPRTYLIPVFFLADPGPARLAQPRSSAREDDRHRGQLPADLQALPHDLRSSPSTRGGSLPRREFWSPLQPLSISDAGQCCRTLCKSRRTRRALSSSSSSSSTSKPSALCSSVPTTGPSLTLQTRPTLLSLSQPAAPSCTRSSTGSSASSKYALSTFFPSASSSWPFSHGLFLLVHLRAILLVHARPDDRAVRRLRTRRPRRRESLDRHHVVPHQSSRL